MAEVASPVARRLKTAILAPVWVLQLFTGYKSFLDNPLVGSRWMNARGLHKLRTGIADALCRRRRARLARAVKPEWVAAFERDGFVVIPDVIPPEDFAALRAAILGYTGPAREMVQGDAITRRLAIDPAMLGAIPALQALLARKDIVALLNYVAGFKTTPLHYIQTIVSHIGPPDADPQEVLHADSFHASLKSWLFLNPVAANEGPFCYVRGSHRFTPARMAWEHRRSLADPRAIDRLSARGSPRVTDADLRAMGLPPAEGLAVAANTLVVADTVGFHARGKSDTAGERVEIWSYARRNPFLPWTGGDLLSLPGIAERRVNWLWALRDRFEPQLGQPWRHVGNRRPTTD